MNLPGKYKFKIEDYEEEEEEDEDEDEDEEHLKRRLPLSIVNIYNMMYEERKWYYNINKT